LVHDPARAQFDDSHFPDLYRDGQKVKETRQSFEDLQSRLAQLYEHWDEAVELN